ncbi:hypothetical protein J5N97_008905 [Dioscorea zingiberensis]|uniref:Stigma-specific Stig1 family protein n=1 Tax=Dioscorea zingiberensis TaxID=325984 RepID=A0A9D5CYH1_9LILI|nr:hypothetical protein J5N97_008905 [Dioscorea zingiberensis]
MSAIFKVLSWLLLLCFIINMIERIYGAVVSPGTHSEFLRAAVHGRRGRYLWCFGDPSVCLDRDKNPWGGNTCCFQRVCKDTMNDVKHCGECGHKCGYGLACCGGVCTNIESDPQHCGSCYHECPSKLECSFGMCGYGDGDL